MIFVTIFYILQRISPVLDLVIILLLKLNHQNLNIKI